ncbi:MAG: PH domain-containing protein [bacterium]|nr:PH domain-containing protein [bacterium]
MAKSGETVRYFKEQFDDEEVLLVFRKHPVVMRKALIYSSIGLLIPTLYTFILTVIYENNPEKLPSVNFFFGSLGLGFVLAAVIMFPFWISWYYSVYIVTDQRLIQITQKGMFNRSMVSFGLNQIQMVNYEIGGFEETVLGFGTIVIQTYVGSLTIHHVHHPAKIQKELLHILRDHGYDMPSQQGDYDESADIEAEEA